MSARQYEGAWSRQAADWYGEQERFTVSGPTDPEHGDKRDAPPPLMMDAPVSLADDGIATDAIWENYEHLPPSLPYDETPVEGEGTPEQTGHGIGGLTTPGADIAELATERGRDYGAPRRATSDRPMYRFITDEFFGFFTRGNGPPPLAQMEGGWPGYYRGVNAHPSNNQFAARTWSSGASNSPSNSWTVDAPSEAVANGARVGDYESSAIQRTFFRPPNRTHGEFKMVDVDIVTIVGDSPPPERVTEAGDTYASPFSSLQKFLPKRRRVSGFRRDPGPWDEDLVAREAGVIAPVSADGMVAN